MPTNESKLRANLQESGARYGDSDPGAPNETVDLGLSYGPDGVPRRSMLLVTRREIVLGASGFVWLAMCGPAAISDFRGQHAWADGTLWSDGLGWVA